MEDPLDADGQKKITRLRPMTKKMSSRQKMRPMPGKDISRLSVTSKLGQKNFFSWGPTCPELVLSQDFKEGDVAI